MPFPGDPVKSKSSSQISSTTGTDQEICVTVKLLDMNKTFIYIFSFCTDCISEYKKHASQSNKNILNFLETCEQNDSNTYYN